jgi:putative glutamine amidotransferase
VFVAVPTYHLAPGRVARWASGSFALPDKYVLALRRARLWPVLLPGPGPDDAEELLSPFAGLFLAGGGDVDPNRYGTDPHPATYGVDADRDDLEFAVVPAAQRLGLPILALCRGMHVVNVAYGGTLHQHLPEMEGHAIHGDPTKGLSVLHEVSIAEGSRLGTALGTRRLPNCSSHHHQAVARIGSGLVPVAWSHDGLVEALELQRGEAWLVGVQWHPEENAADQPAQQRIFDAFGERVREHARVTRSRDHLHGEHGFARGS